MLGIALGLPASLLLVLRELALGHSLQTAASLGLQSVVGDL